MKTLKKRLLPAFILLIGVGAAFATNAATTSEKAIQNGYYFDNAAPTVKCIRTDVKCSTQGSQYCTWTDGSQTHNLFKKINGTMCGDQLFKTN